MHARTRLLLIVCLALLPIGAQAAEAPFPYVWGKAYHVLPETHNNESGYFSLCEGNDGKIYVGTAKYGVNSYLVEFDPKTEQQKIVLDTHKVCGLADKGFAAQAKLHTRNYVGRSGKVYVGSKQGYPEAGDTSQYPGGYLMVYDPVGGKVENLGLPRKSLGLIDVVADESRNLIYLVTCEVQNWLAFDTQTRQYRDLGQLLTPYATTLVDSRGRAAVLREDFQLAQYDPSTQQTTVRPIEVDGTKFVRANTSAIPTWNLAADGRTAYLVLMNDPTLIAIDLQSEGPVVRAKSHGKLIAGKNPDSRCALTVAPDGQVYAIVRVDNDTNFGTGYLHHVVRFNPKTAKSEDLGVLAVKNPDFFNFAGSGSPPPFSNGFHRLPDGTLTPLHHHMALIAAKDGSLYATIISPFALIKIEPPPAKKS